MGRIHRVILTIALIYLILFITARISGRKDFVFLTLALFCLFLHYTMA